MTRQQINTSTHQRGRKLHAQFGIDPPPHGRVPLSTTQLIMLKMTWNIRRLNGMSKQRTLRDNNRVENPNIILLQEKNVMGKSLRTFFNDVGGLVTPFTQIQMGM
jgi:hypothetical protein